MFRDVLRNLRKSKNMTQEQLASAIGVERSTIGKYEGAKNNEPSLDVLKKLADFFHVSTDYLLEHNTIRAVNIETEDEEHLLLNYRSFNERGKEKIREEIYIMVTSGIYKNIDNPSGMEAKELGMKP